MPEKSLLKWALMLSVLGLLAMTLILFWPLRHHDFVSYDDVEYVTENPQVSRGLSWEGLTWAFSSGHAVNWHPITWISHMTDVELFGMKPGLHHLVSLFFHAANTILLFLVLLGMTGSRWRSIFVASLFSVHPLHVESVAWLAERKDVLSTFFWILTIAAYLRYVRNPELKRYLPIIPAFVLGLMSKPMLVSLPFLLLVVDFWPLGRLVRVQPNAADKKESRPQPPLRRLLWEKAPLFFLATASSVITYFVQARGEAVVSFHKFPMFVRISNALVSYMKYILKTIWPMDLAVFYPHLRDGLPSWQVVLSLLLLLTLVIMSIRCRRRHPYLVAGLSWYLVTLVPVIGLIQVGNQAMADRYTYVPLIGLFVAASWAWPTLTFLRANHYRAQVIALVVVLLLFTVSTRNQLKYWKDDNSLYQHALEVTADNWLVHTLFGFSLIKKEKFEEAAGHFREAIRIKPYYDVAHMKLGEVLHKQGHYEEALPHFTKVLSIKPADAEAHNNLGVVLSAQGKTEEAISHYSQAIQVNPQFAEAYNNLGLAQAKAGRINDAVANLSRALSLKPSYYKAHYNLGTIMDKAGRKSEAIEHYREATRLKPDYKEAYWNMGMTYLSIGDRDSAVSVYEDLNRISPTTAEQFLKFMNFGR